MKESRNQSVATLEPVVSKLERFVLYETTSHLYLTASDKRETQYRVLKIDRRVNSPACLADICQEDPIVYTPMDMLEMLDMIHEGNRTVGGLHMTAKGFGIVGFVKFLDCYYLNFITQRRLVSRFRSDSSPQVATTRCSRRVTDCIVLYDAASCPQLGRGDWWKPYLRDREKRDVCDQTCGSWIGRPQLYGRTRYGLQRLRQHLSESQSATKPHAKVLKDNIGR